MAIRFEPIPPTPVNLARAGGLATLARAWTATSPTPSPANLRAEPGDDATLDLDESSVFSHTVFRVLTKTARLTKHGQSRCQRRCR